MSNPMLDAALRYIALGWPVLPLHAHDKRQWDPGAKEYELVGKEPNGKLAPHGSKDATLDSELARKWWQANPRGNVGLATGHRFFVVDIDPRHGGDETWVELKLKYGSVPDTLIQQTGGGGQQYFFSLPDFPVQNDAHGKLGDGIDIRGKGGYVVAPPSIHPISKRKYFFDGLEIDELDQQPIAPAPAWLLRLLQAESRKKSSPVQPPEKIGSGKRNDTLFRNACSLRAKGFSEHEISALMLAMNRDRCEPPLPDDEVRTIATSAARYPAGRMITGRDSHAPRPDEAELPLSRPDIEAAVDACIEKDDLPGAMELIPEMAKLNAVAIAVLKAKLGMKFKRWFSSRDFDRGIREARGEAEPPQNRPPDDPDGEEPPDSGAPNLLWYPLTDSGNAERLVAMYGTRLRYHIERKKWLVWDGKRWAIDEKQAAMQLMKNVARELYNQARRETKIDLRQFEKIQKWARDSEAHGRINAALALAAGEGGIPVAAADLDTHPFLLNCANGVVDLRKGELLPHNRDYLITKLCDIPFDPAAECPRFMAFIEWAMGHTNPESECPPEVTRMVTFLAKMFGYCLTADTSEKCIFVFYGPTGNNGKTTLLNLFRNVLGLNEYSSQISIEVLMMQRQQDATMRADLADLLGARLVVTSEVEEGSRMNEQKLKVITAGASTTIKSCRKYENPIEFIGTHKLVMDCNYRPNVKGLDLAIWNRLRSIPFNSTMPRDDPGYDPKLLEKLMAEAAGILAWAVRGAVEWAKGGLGVPVDVLRATDEWREHDDPLRDFLGDCCETGEERWVRSSELTAAYAWWCKENAEKYPLGRTKFMGVLEAKGFRYSRGKEDANGKKMRVFVGLALNDEAQTGARSMGEGRWT